MRILIITSLDNRKNIFSAPDFKMSLALAYGLIELGHYIYFLIPDKKLYKQDWRYDDIDIENVKNNFKDKGEIVFCPLSSPNFFYKLQTVHLVYNM